jgi:hypothetical protein
VSEVPLHSEHLLPRELSCIQCRTSIAAISTIVTIAIAIPRDVDARAG